MLLILYLLFASGLTLYIYNKHGVINASFIHSFYCLGCMFVIYFIYQNNLMKEDFIFTAMPMPYFGDVINTVLLSYLMLIVVAAFLLPHKQTASETGNIDRIQSQLKEFDAFISNPNNFLYIILITGIFILCNFIHYLSIDNELLYTNDFYQILKTPELVGLESPVAKIYHILFRYLGLIFALLFFLTFSFRRYLLAAIFFAGMIYPFIYLYVGETRWAAFYLLWGIVFWAINKQPVKAFFIFILLIIVLIKVLVGRELPLHGIHHMWDFYAEISFVGAVEIISGLFVNTFEGAMNLANSLLYDREFDSSYKLLSFSPFFSFMDNFSTIKDMHEQRISVHVPMSALSQAYSFGFGYLIVFLAIYFSLLYQVNLLLSKSFRLMSVISILSFTYISIGIHTYSIRTFWKMMLFILVLHLFTNLKNAKLQRLEKGK